MRIALFFMACVCAAETSVAPPFLGVVRDCAGKPHQVFGVAGAFVVDAEESGAGLRPADPLSAGPSRLKAGLRAKLPAPHGQLEQMGPGWLAAWPYAIRVTADGAEIYRLPVRGCVVHP